MGQGAGAVRDRCRPFALVAGPYDMAEIKRLAGNRWSAERVQTFFETLAETCNVKAAERAAEMGDRSSYMRRKRDAEFRAAWDEAFAEGYMKIQLIAMERAMNGEQKPVRHKVSQAVIDHDVYYSDRLILTLLAAHRRTAERVRAGVDREAVKRSSPRRSPMHAGSSAMNDLSEFAGLGPKGRAHVYRRLSGDEPDVLSEVWTSRRATRRPPRAIGGCGC